MENIIYQSFATNIRIMKYLGVWSMDQSKFAKVKSLFFFISLLGVCFLMPVIQLITIKGWDLRLDITMIHGIEVIGCFGKLLPFLTQNTRTKKCMFYFTNSFFEPQQESEWKILNDFVKESQRNSMVFLSVLVCAWILWCVMPVAGNQLIIDGWIPFEFKSQPVAYGILFFYIIMALGYMIFAGIFLDPLIGGLINQATTHMKILKCNIKIIDKFIENETGSFDRVQSILQRFVIYHNHIYNYITELENLFSWSIFGQISGCTFGMCFASIALMFTTETMDMLLFVNCLMALTLQIAFYCYYGTLLFEENEQFMNSIYMTQWYQYDNRVRKYFFLMMERSKRPLIVTAGKIVNLTLQTFTSLMKTSYSLIAVFSSNF